MCLIIFVTKAEIIKKKEREKESKMVSLLRSYPPIKQ